MRLVVGMTGATGAELGIRVLHQLRELGVETHLVLSRWARATIELETSWSVREVWALATAVHSADDHTAPIASGSFRTDGMVVVPCTARTLATIRHGTGTGLISRAADVVLKERRRLVLVVRETPLSTIHLENMLGVTQAGATVFPPVPAFYNAPHSLDDVLDHTVARILDQFGLEVPGAARWTGATDAKARRTITDGTANGLRYKE